MRALRSLVIVGFLALVASSCGTASDPDLEKLRAELKALQQEEREAEVELARIEESIEEPSGETTDTTEKGAVVADSSKLDIAFYYAEFKVTLGTAKVVPATETDGAHLVIDFECENIGIDEAYCPSDMSVESNKKFYGVRAEDPRVPSGKTATGTYRANIDEAFSLAGAVLLVGSAPRHVVSIPLCPGKDATAPVLLEPVDLPASGSVTAGLITATLKGLQLRADLHSHNVRDKDKLTLVLNLDVVAKPNTKSCCYYLGYDRFAVKRPDGNTSEAGRWTERELRVERDVNVSDARVYFEIDNPPAGNYQLELTGVDDAGAKAVATLGFSISEG